MKDREKKKNYDAERKNNTKKESKYYMGLRLCCMMS